MDDQVTADVKLEIKCPVPSDIEIARSATATPIVQVRHRPGDSRIVMMQLRHEQLPSLQVARNAGIRSEELDLYGATKAKASDQDKS